MRPLLPELSMLVLVRHLRPRKQGSSKRAVLQHRKQARAGKVALLSSDCRRASMAKVGKARAGCAGGFLAGRLHGLLE
jgi:hypothetical protein